MQPFHLDYVSFCWFWSLAQSRELQFLVRLSSPHIPPSVSLWSAQKSQKVRIRISLWYHPHSESWVASRLTGWLGHCYGWCAPAELKLPSKVRAECVYFYCLSATRSELTRLRVFTIKLKLCNYSSGPGREKKGMSSFRILHPDHIHVDQDAEDKDNWLW